VEIDGPNRKGAFVGTVSEFVRLASSARQIIKGIDPTARIVGPSVVGDLGPDRLRAFLAAGGKYAVDIVGYHFYSRVPEDIPWMVEKVRRVMTEFGMGDVELWNTESGYLIDYPEGSIPAEVSKGSTVLTPYNAGAFVARSLVLGAAAGLDRFFYYAWDLPWFGLAIERGRLHSPASKGYITTVTWLRGTTIHGCDIRDEGVYFCSLERDGSRAWLVWNPEEARLWEPPARWVVRGYSTLEGGGTYPFTRRPFYLTPMPTLLLEDPETW
jgi:hypothetical protein